MKNGEEKLTEKDSKKTATKKKNVTGKTKAAKVTASKATTGRTSTRKTAAKSTKKESAKVEKSADFDAEVEKVDKPVAVNTLDKEAIEVKEEKEEEEVKEKANEKESAPLASNHKKYGVKATFFQRFVAFILDVFLVSMLASILVLPFVDNDKAEKLNNESLEVIEKYSSAEIDLDTYVTEMTSLTYQTAKSNGVVTLVTLVCEILYFVVFQLYNNGQTLGKKLLKIKVISEDGSLTMNQMIFRSFIVNSILLEIISFCFMLFADEMVYFYGVATLEMLQYAVLVISAFMIMYGATGKGIHDKVVHTRVIRI